MKYEYLKKRLEHPEWIKAPRPLAEYSSEVRGERFDRLLEMLGASGWELVTILEAEKLIDDPEEYKYEKYVAYFKRIIG